MPKADPRPQDRAETLSEIGGAPVDEAVANARKRVERDEVFALTFSRTNHHAQRAGFICELKDARFETLSG